MPDWTVWLVFGLLVWLLLSVALSFGLGRFLRLTNSPGEREAAEAAPGLPEQGRERPAEAWALGVLPTLERRRILVVDDDRSLRLLLRTTLATDEFAIEEADSSEQASELARLWRPDVVVLDIGLPGKDGLTFCGELKRNPRYGGPLVILLTGGEPRSDEIEDAGADALLRKPFSPLELVMLLDRLSAPVSSPIEDAEEHDAEQLLIYARDLNRLLQTERAQRRLLQQGYRQTAVALADALEAKDPVTGLHALRVQRLALELAAAVDNRLLADPSLEYGFLLHDVGKIGIPDTILQKRGPLSDAERRAVERHTLVGVEILRAVAPLQGEGLQVVRSHHERWDGGGYPDGLRGRRIPLGARVFAVADALDAMTSERPYREVLSWDAAVDEILAGAGTQFDPHAVAAFAARERRLRVISQEFAEHAA
jgi:ribonuclease P protein subunit RPR2